MYAYLTFESLQFESVKLLSLSRLSNTDVGVTNPKRQHLVTLEIPTRLGMPHIPTRDAPFGVAPPTP